jgi:hypothetical protein
VDKTAFSLLAALLLSAGTILADGPARLQVSKEQPIIAPPEAVWAVVGNFQDMSWLPAVTETQGRGGNAPGATRTLTLNDGGQIFERLETYDPANRSLEYRIEQVDPKVLPVSDYTSRISVGRYREGSSVVSWKGAFYRGDRGNDPPADPGDQAAIDAVAGVYKAGLDNLKSLLERGARGP